MFSTATLDSVNLLAAKFDPNGKVSPYLEGGIQAVAQRLSPTSPGVANGPRSQDPAVTRGPAVSGWAAWWLYLKSRPMLIAGIALGVGVVVWLVVKKKKA